MWTLADLTFELDGDLTDHPVITVVISTPAGELKVMAEPVLRDGSLFLRWLDIQGATANAVGWPNLRVIADIVMREWGIESVVVEGAVRTTGATPGRTPHPIRFTGRR